MPAAAPRKLLALTTNIADLPGVGAKRAESFRKLGIRGVADLLQHFPMRYEHQLPQQTIAAAGEFIGPNHGAEANIVLQGEIAAARAPHPFQRRRAPFQATLSDGTGTIKLAWFNSPWLAKKLHPGSQIIVAGKATRHGDYLQMINPKWQPVDPTGKQFTTERAELAEGNTNQSFSAR
ncbi:MAG: hypothetical protein L0Z53_01930, partial [Acidobacteriales bacterium]|nr:hypothetical protein [Terriglobales bacterium]